MTNPQLSERLKSLMWDLGPDRYIVMRELILEAQRLERMQPDSLRAVEPAGKHEVVKYPDPPYELLGDSGKIHCPMCCGEGMVDPPSENRT